MVRWLFYSSTSHFSVDSSVVCVLLQDGKEETRRIPVPANRYTPLKENWLKIFTPIVEHLGLQIRFNLKSRNVEIRVRRMPTISKCTRVPRSGMKMDA